MPPSSAPLSPTASTTTDVRLTRVGLGLRSAGEAFQLLSLSVHTPFLGAISTGTAALAGCVKTIRQNKRECVELLEQSYIVLNALLPLYLNADTKSEVSPAVMASVGRLSETLYIVHSFVEAQQEGSRFRKLFRQGELSGLLKNAKAGLQAALDVFKVSIANSISQVAALQAEAEEMHQRVLDYVAMLTDDGASEGRPSVLNSTFSTSSRSFSLLPSKPKIFCGRELELAEVCRLFTSAPPSSPPRIAILGPGGIGKTSLAHAVLHATSISALYPEETRRIFVACDAAMSRIDIAERIAAYLGLKPSRDFTRPVLKALEEMTKDGKGILLALDNLETAWERDDERTGVEELLGQLAEIQCLALLITMRGAERPAGVHWTRPFFPPLGPLTPTAARQMFLDIADHGSDDSDADLEKIIAFTDNVPLAITLLAHLVDSEGYATVLSRWENEKTLLVSDGYDRGSNLNFSIQISLSSPRIAQLPQAVHLLGLLSLSPDGISDVELQLMNLPIADILRCKTTLLRTALAYVTEQQRLKVLVPIQEYVLRFEPPPRDVARAALQYYINLMNLDRMYEGTTSSPAIVQRLRVNMRNIQRVVLDELATLDADPLAASDSDIRMLGETILRLNNFSQVLLHIHRIPLMARIPDLLEKLGNDPVLDLQYITELLNSQPHMQMSREESSALVQKGKDYIESGRMDHDPVQQCKFYSIIGNVYTSTQKNLIEAYNAYETGLSIARSINDQKREANFLRRLAMLRSRDGEYLAGRQLARQAQLLAKMTGNLYREAASLGVEAVCCVALGELSAAKEMYLHTRELYARCGMEGSYADCSLAHDLSELHLARSEYPDALVIVHDIITHMSAPGELATGVSGLLELSLLQARSAMGEPRAELEPLLERAEGFLRQVGYVDQLMVCRLVYAQLLCNDGDVKGAYELLLAIFKSPHELQTVELRKEFVERLSYLASVGGVSSTIPGAADWSTLLLVQSIKLKVRPGMYKAFRDLGVLAYHVGDTEMAKSLLRLALEGLTEMEIHQARGECFEYLGEIIWKEGGEGWKEKVREYWDIAKELFERSGMKGRVEEMEGKVRSLKEIVEIVVPS
uniref:Orc1-like AAA ATPase domain-containing protein n=1 Tax=Mycena chlorophos TaxID=658473 RepID=A0ABQ0LJ08_MYCCL|nr:predicted protein [Mycena chlorophos]